MLWSSSTGCPLRWLASPNLAENRNVAETHGLSRAELVDVVHTLATTGDLLINRVREGGSEFFVRSPTELDTILTKRVVPYRQDVYYGLSEQGGERWGAHAAPDWERYLQDGFTPDLGTGEAESGRRDLVEQWLAAQRDLGDEQPMEDSIRRDVLSPWQAPYWKRLPVGHRVRFRYRTERTDRPNWPTAWGRRVVWWSKALHDYPFQPKSQ